MYPVSYRRDSKERALNTARPRPARPKPVEPGRAAQHFMPIGPRFPGPVRVLGHRPCIRLLQKHLFDL